MKAIMCRALGLLAVFATAGWASDAAAGVEGSSSTFYGTSAGLVSDPSGGGNAFFGFSAGKSNTTGSGNTFVGASAGFSSTANGYNTHVGAFTGYLNTIGFGNTFIGASAGANTLSSERSVFIGYGAGANNPSSYQLVIDNCMYTGVKDCDRPMISGNFQQRTFELNAVMGVTADRHSSLARSQLHFSVNGADEGGWLTSAGENNFFTSSGARYDANAGGWIQRSADGKAVIAGSGAAGYRVLTSSGAAVGAIAVPVSRLHVDYNGAMGVNTAPAAGRAINTSTGAYLSSGGMWVNASSRDLKEDIHEITPAAALQALHGLQPVTYRYKSQAGETHAGFIAEDVPELVATADRKGLSAIEVVAVLTKVVQRQDAEIEQLKAQVRELLETRRRD